MLLRKNEAEQSRKKMLDDEMAKIEKCVTMGESSRNLLVDLIQIATTPFHHRQSNYVTVTTGSKEITCTSFITMSALDGVLSAKRKSDKMSRLEAKRKVNVGKKIKRTSNTTREDDGISTVFWLKQFDKSHTKTDNEKEMKKTQQQIELTMKELTKW